MTGVGSPLLSLMPSNGARTYLHTSFPLPHTRAPLSVQAGGEAVRQGAGLTVRDEALLAHDNGRYLGEGIQLETGPATGKLIGTGRSGQTHCPSGCQIPRTAHPRSAFQPPPSLHATCPPAPTDPSLLTGGRGSSSSRRRWAWLSSTPGPSRLTAWSSSPSTPGNVTPW